MSRKLYLVAYDVREPSRLRRALHILKDYAYAGQKSVFECWLNKSDHAGIVFKEVNEAYTTQTCSCCGALPDSRPKGIAGLGIREWTCSACGVTHSDRDVNAARNILAVGHGRLVVGIPLL